MTTTLVETLLPGPNETPAAPSPSNNEYPQEATTSIQNGHAVGGDGVNDLAATAARTPRPRKSSAPGTVDGDEAAWGSNFWVTLVDPQVR
jgi:hypothetical protein